jgi:hypothetical protein
MLEFELLLPRQGVLVEVCNIEKVVPRRIRISES